MDFGSLVYRYIYAVCFDLWHAVEYEVLQDCVVIVSSSQVCRSPK